MVGRAFGSVQRTKGWHSTHMGKILELLHNFTEKEGLRPKT